MHRASLTAFALAALLPVMAPANRAEAMTMAAPPERAAAADARSLRTVDFVCDWKCGRRWRQYWQWDQRPVWDDPWTLLHPNIMGSPEPYVMRADRWAHQWHPPWIRYWHTHHPH